MVQNVRNSIRGSSEVGRENHGSFQRGKESATEGGNFALSKLCRDIPMGRAMLHTC